MRMLSDLRPRERAASLRTTFLLPPCFHGDEFVEASFRINRAKSSKFNGLLARPKRFELLTPRFVVWCSIQLSYGRVLRIAREKRSQNEQSRRERASSYRLRPPMARFGVRVPPSPAGLTRGSIFCARLLFSQRDGLP